jgi:hypothetical protein
VVTRGEIQQALLKPAFARLYPGIRANEWYPVAAMLDLVRTSKRHLGERMPPAEHVLDAEHFAFRGTASQGAKDADREGRTEARKPRRPK